MRKKVDERIRTLIDNGVKCRHRSFFIIIGDKSRDQIVNIHYMLSKAVVKARPTVLWCYKEKLELSSHKRKRTNQVKKLVQKGLVDPEKVDPFSLFVESGKVTYCLYKDSDRVLGNTFGMCILQDFEALEPNLLGRTIATVEGGGIIVLLLRSLSSLTSLYTMVMDVHQRFRTESHSEVTGRFNERFLLSIASCKASVVVDDEMNILPISSHMKSIAPIHVEVDSEGLSTAEDELKNLKDELNQDFPVGPLIKKCCTLDQGRAVVTFMDGIMDKTIKSTIAILAGRGRGKSAALGLALAGAVASGYSNIFVSAPSPENLKTLFEFVCKGLESLNYKEHIDYDVVRSSHSRFKKLTVQINIYKQHRQTIQYIQPHEHEKLSQVELLVIDEAAAIPSLVVKSLLGPYLIFISSTVNGYEGTGRSLSLKLLQKLEEQSQISKNVDSSISGRGRVFKKIELSESIRYASGDPIESWLNGLLCLDASNFIPKIHRFPPLSECNLYYVNRDTLFSYHQDSELFLQRVIALFVASHYKNAPNDLQLMADAPAHHLYVLLGSVDTSKSLPEILCAIQVCLEGQISRKSTIRTLSTGRAPDGDQLPWKFCEQFQDKVFPSLSGARIVRIATHPSVTGKGYGSRAVQLLTRYFEGRLTSMSETYYKDDAEKSPVRVVEAAEKVSSLEENIKPKTNLPHLLVHLSERRPEKLHYIGVSFGLTLDLYRFWRKNKFAPFYICQIPNPVTGEHTCMVLKPLHNDDMEVDTSNEWGFIAPFLRDFKQRFIRLLGSNFRSMEFELAMSILNPRISFTELESLESSLDVFSTSIYENLSQHDMERLRVFTNDLDEANVHMEIQDLVLVLAHLYFQERIPVTLSYTEASVLLCMGLQNQNFPYTKGRLKELDCKEITSSLRKVLKKFSKYLSGTAFRGIESTLPRLKQMEMQTHS